MHRQTYTPAKEVSFKTAIIVLALSLSVVAVLIDVFANAVCK